MEHTEEAGYTPDNIDLLTRSGIILCLRRAKYQWLFHLIPTEALRYHLREAIESGTLDKIP